MKRNFRKLATSRWKWGVIDIVGHLAFALLLPGCWAWQLVPDTFLLPLFITSWKTDNFLSEESWLVLFHHIMHKGYIPGLVMAIGVFSDKPWLAWGGVQMITHVIWDQCTHTDEEFKKRFW